MLRRDILKLALSAGGWGAASALGCRRAERARGTQRQAQYWVQVLLSGGHDTLYTTDPKTQADVDEIVTLPVNNQSVTAGDLRFGSGFAGLQRWGKQLAVLNGVQVHTANHDTGQKQFVHLKTNITDGIPTALDIIASHRAGQPLGVAYLNISSRSLHSPRYFGTADKFYFGEGDVFEQVAKAKPDELAALAAEMRKQAGQLARSSSGWREAEQTVAYMREVADFFEHVATVPALTVEQQSTDYVLQSMSETFQRALWLIENDLTCGIIIDIGQLGWDTHIRNDSKQHELNTGFATFFDDFMAELHMRSNKRGRLVDRTVVAVGSELGRFPKQNDMLGKDHLPQTSFLFTGPGIRAGSMFGATGRRMEGLPIDFGTGRQAAAGRTPLLDDVGATMLHLAGLDPERYGYVGRVCNFLLDKTS